LSRALRKPEATSRRVAGCAGLRLASATAGWARSTARAPSRFGADPPQCQAILALGEQRYALGIVAALLDRLDDHRLALVPSLADEVAQHDASDAGRQAQVVLIAHSCALRHPDAQAA